MSFGSLFNVGTPPRQGGPKPGDPYKTYDFNIGDEGEFSSPTFVSPLEKEKGSEKEDEH